MNVQRRKIITLCLMIAPGVLLVFVFNYLPMYGVLYAFQNFKPYLGFLKSPWVGFENYRVIFASSSLWSALRNTVILNFISLVATWWMPIIFAILVNEINSVRFKKTVQSISYLPHFFSWVVVSRIVIQLLSPVDGLLNQVRGLFGMDPIYFMIESRYFRGIVIISHLWKGLGYSSILYFAQIASIDDSLFEAAYIDGANRLKQIYHITLPGMMPMILLMLLLRLASFLGSDFESIFLLQNPTIYDVSEVLSTFVYRLGLVEAKYSYGTAVGFVLSIVSFTTLTLSNRISKKLSGMGLY